MNRDKAYLADIRNACRHIVEFTQGVSEDDFFRDVEKVLAVRHELIVIGEAVKRLSEAFRHAHPEVPWRDIAATRNKMVHEYDTVDDTVVLEIARGDIPTLLDSVLGYLSE